MLKRKIAALTLAFFTLTFIPVLPSTKAFAYTNAAYSSEVKIGLEHMAAPVIIAKTNGDYYLNNILIPSGTILSLSITNGKVNINGTEYSTVSITPKIYGSLFSLTSGTETNNYLGNFTFKVDNGRVYPINSLPLEDYLKGVVGYEMSDSYPAEALKAQAVAARTYALSNEGTLMTTKGFDFDDTPSYQVYYGYNPAYKNVIKSVSDTIGQVITYNNTLIDAFFSASHGGYTEDMRNVWGYSDPYLISKPDVFNGQTIDNGAWSFGTKSFNNADIQAKLVSKGLLSPTETFVKLDLNSITRYPSGRVSNINVIYNDAGGVQKVKYITADRCRTFLSLQSSMWNLSYDGITYTFTGKGYGHGLGMSQLGAKQRATLGQPYDQILKFYYDSTQLAYLYTAPSIASYSASANQSFLGQPINLNAQGLNGSGRYQYKFAIIKDGSYLTDSGFGTSSSFSFVPTQPGSYQFILYLKDVESTAAYDASKSVSASVYSLPAISSALLTKTQLFLGQSTDVSLAATGGSGNYLYKYTVSKDGSIVSVKDFSSDKAYSFAPNAAGNYIVNAYLKDAALTKPYDESAAMSLVVTNYASVGGFSESSQQVLVGQPIAFNGSGADGTGRYLYKYVITNNGNPAIAKDFDASSSFSFTPSTAGTYTASLFIKDVLSDKPYDNVKDINFTAYQAPSINSFTENKTIDLLGQNINFNTLGQNGSGSYLFKYVVTNAADGTIVYTQDYSNSNSCAYNPTAPGNFNVTVYLKDILSTKDYEDSKALNFTIVNTPSISGFNLDKPQILLGQSSNVNLNIQGGSSNYLYRYEVTKNGAIVYTKDYSSDSTLAYAPTEASNYKINVFVKDAASDNTYDVSASANLVAYGSPVISSFTCDSNNSLVGQAMNFSVQAQGGSGDISYKFVVLKDWNFVTETQFSYNSSYSYLPTQPGNYEIYVYIKDKLETSQNSGLKRILTTVYSAPQICNTSSMGYMYIGKPVTINTSYTGGSTLGANLRYEVYNNGTLFTSKGFSTDKTFSFIPTIGGTFTVKLYIKDAVSKNASDGMKYFDLNLQSVPVSVSALPLYYGMRSQDVITIQTALIKLGYNISSATGLYGSQTQAAVNAFQKDKLLLQTGTVDQITLNAINESLIIKSGIQTINY